MTRHRGAPVRPRYGRVAAASTSLVITAVSLLGGAGALPSAADDAAPETEGLVLSRATSTPSSERRDAGAKIATGSEARSLPSRDVALPEDSGTGTRVVFSEERQRVWLVEGRHRVVRTYLVSGSIYDNLDPGTFTVYSRSEQAWGIDDSGSMRWFVRFAQGDAGAAIGFHTIPVDEGEKLQTVAQLGTPLSHGCIRQRTADAKALWDFAPVGTTVVVV